MKKRMTALALLLSLLLAACGAEVQDGGSRSSFLEEASGLKSDTVLLTVDGREVPAWRYLYWLAHACGQMREAYQTSGQIPDWCAPVGDGTLADVVKEQALADTVLYATVENQAEEYACVAEDSEKHILPDMGLTEEQMAELESVGRLYAALYDVYATEGSSLFPAKEALAGYAQEQGILAVNRMLFSAGEDRDAARQRAEEAFSRLNGAEDQVETFGALAAESDDSTGVRTLRPGEMTLEESLVAAAQVLESGQCSGILETEEGFSILMRADVPNEELMEEYFDHLLQTSAENASVILAPEYSALDAAAFAESFCSAMEQPAEKAEL